jgi:hypothetical protein
MNDDDDTNAGGDLFIDMVKVVIVLFLFILFVTLLGGIVWSLL